MKEPHRHSPAFFLTDAIVIVICILGLYHVSQKAGIPVRLDESNGRIICAEVLDRSYEQYFHAGEAVIAADGIRVSEFEDLEFILDARRIGDRVNFEIEDANGTREAAVPLTAYYGVDYIIAAGIVGGLFVLTGFLVNYLRPKEVSARLFHWGSVTAAVMMLSTWWRYTIEPVGLGYILRALFFVAHGFLAVVFFHFTLVFPREKLPSLRRFIVLTYLLALVMSVWPVLTFMQAAFSRSMGDVHRFLSAFETARWFLVVFGVLSLASVVHSYLTASEEVERRKLRWILWGLLIGFPPYIVLWVVPQMLLKHGIVPEEIVLLFSALIPVTFAVAIVRHRAMDIDIILNRSLVYGAVMVLVLSVYAGIVGLATVVVVTWTSASSFVISAFAAVLVALLFEPVRARVQHVVDKKFFRVHYDFREAQRALAQDIKDCFGANQLAELVVSRIDGLFSPERIGFFRVKQPNDRLVLLAHKNYENLKSHGVRFESERLTSNLRAPVALDEKIEPSAAYESADPVVFGRWGMAIVFAMLSEHGEILGMLVLGQKRSGGRYSLEDVDLLNAIASQAGLAMQRISLQQKLLLEHEETQRLEELNRLKSYFVSSVSHDLKTPLTSIKVFAEMLQSGKRIPAKKAKEYLEIIEGETDRLTRLINNVLDFGTIERGTMEYHFSKVDLNDIVRNVVRTMKYQLSMEGFVLRTSLGKRDISIHADSDAVAEALINILSNAMKYSGRRKNIKLSTFRRNGFAGVRVEDEGIGIPPGDLDKIFQPFYRVREEKAQQAGGAGLGLALVKHTLDAHKGTIEVQSNPGKGSSFTLLFPLGDFS